jgi:hypothetical protein
VFCRFTGHPLRPETQFNFHYFPEGCPSLDAVIQAFGPDAMLRPKINAGDVVLLSNWIIHGTYRTDMMKRGRMNAELRFIGDAIDIMPRWKLAP